METFREQFGKPPGRKHLGKLYAGALHDHRYFVNDLTKTVTVVGVVFIILALAVEQFGRFQPVVLLLFGGVFLWGGSFYRKKVKKLDKQLAWTQSHLEINIDKAQEFIDD
jgi:uncharacterized membrane protein